MKNLRRFYSTFLESTFRKFQAATEHVGFKATCVTPSSSIDGSSSVADRELRGLALLFGWLGSHKAPRAVKKYADIMTANELACVCVTPSLQDTWLSKPSARRISQLTKSINETFPSSVPTVIYAFSGASNQLLYHLAKQIEKEELNLEIKGFIFDSGPARFSRSGGLEAAKLLRMQGRYRGHFGSLLYYAQVSSGLLSNYCFGEKIRLLEDDFQRSPTLIHSPQLYLHSESDRVSTPEYVSHIIRNQRGNGATVFEKLWKTPLHLRLLVDHPDEYKKEVDVFINKYL